MKRSVEDADDKQKRKKIHIFHQEVGELGLIESVSLRNFMCHDNLKFDFGPHMNFIIGLNGSGKSAIMTAIILALGGKSSATGRFSNVKGFIKTGKQSATVSVTLKNCGSSAYKVEEYGDKIIIERALSSDGTSSYKTKSAAGRIISASKENVTAILNAMDIQIENPVTVLTQETSRNFLLSKNARKEKLYQLFYKGTGLQKLEENYTESKRQKIQAEAELEHKKSVLPEMEKDIKRWKNLIDSSAKITDYKHELVWAGVIQMEKLSDEKEKECKNCEKEVTKFKEKLKESQSEYSKISADMDKYTAGKKVCEAAMKLCREEITELRKKEDVISRSVREAQGLVDRNKREAVRLADEIMSLQNSMNENKLKSQNDIDEDKKKREEEIKNLEEKIFNIQKGQEKWTELTNKLKAKKEDLFRKLNSLGAEYVSELNQTREISKFLQYLHNAMENRINVFGPETANVKQAIELAAQKGEFQKKPIGPIGMYLEVKDSKWAFAVETCLSQAILKGFCCDNSRDRAKLSEIFSRFYSNYKMPTIFTGKFAQQIYDVHEFKARSSHPTVFDMIKFKDPVIANCLIDEVGIENILLIEDRMTAVSLMLDHPPEKCRSAYVLTGDQICLNPYRYYSCVSQSRKLLETVNADQISTANQKLEEAKANVAHKVQQQEIIKKEIDQCSSDINQINFQAHRSMIEQGALNQKMEELKCFEEPRDIYCLQGDLEQLQKEKESIEHKLAVSEEEFKEKYKAKTSCSNAISIKAKSLEEEYRKCQDLGRKICECESRKAELDASRKHFDSDVRNLEANLLCLKKEYSEGKKQTQEALKNAKEICKRINTDRSTDTIRKLLEETTKALETQSKCDKEVIHDKYNEKYEKLVTAQKDMKRIQEYISQVGQMVNNRFSELKEIRIQTQLCLNMSFTTVLNSNRFYGSLEFDDKAQTLNIKAWPKKTSVESGSSQSCSTLSGGERSFVTISFLLALWDRIDMPFRILDEYDVFMDSDNRHLSVNLLIKSAEQKKDIQYIFLSPLELPVMEHSPFIKVHKMPAPKRSTAS